MIRDRILAWLAPVALLASSLLLLAACGTRTGTPSAAASGGAPAAAASPSTTASSGASSPALGAGYTPYSGASPIIAASDPQAKSVTLAITGAEGTAARGFNFDGYANGAMIIRVPEGWKVTMSFKVDSRIPHSLAVVEWDQRQGSLFTDAFVGSSMPSPKSGITKSDAPVSFSFTAGKAGRYAMVCEVPGHDDLGMWDELEVVSALAKPEVLVKAQ